MAKLKWTTAQCVPCRINFEWTTDDPIESMRCHHCFRDLTMRRPRKSYTRIRLFDFVRMNLKPITKAAK